MRATMTVAQGARGAAEDSRGGWFTGALGQFVSIRQLHALLPCLVTTFTAMSCPPAIGATMTVVDKLPFFGDFFELVGLAVIATYTYRYVTDPSER